MWLYGFMSHSMAQRKTTDIVFPNLTNANYSLVLLLQLIYEYYSKCWHSLICTTLLLGLNQNNFQYVSSLST